MTFFFFPFVPLAKFNAIQKLKISIFHVFLKDTEDTLLR